MDSETPFPFNWEFTLDEGLGCLLVVCVHSADPVEQGREHLRHACGPLHVKRASRDRQVALLYATLARV